MEWLWMYSLISSSVIYDGAQGRGHVSVDHRGEQRPASQVGGSGRAVLADTYTIGIRVTHVEKVVRVRRVRLGFKSIPDRVCAADTHRKSHSANQDVHVVFRREETVAVRVSIRDTRARYRLLWIDDGLIVHARRLDGDSPNAFRLQN